MLPSALMASVGLGTDEADECRRPASLSSLPADSRPSLVDQGTVPPSAALPLLISSSSPSASIKWTSAMATTNSAGNPLQAGARGVEEANAVALAAAFDESFNPSSDAPEEGVDHPVVADHLSDRSGRSSAAIGEIKRPSTSSWPDPDGPLRSLSHHRRSSSLSSLPPSSSLADLDRDDDEASIVSSAHASSDEPYHTADQTLRRRLAWADLMLGFKVVAVGVSDDED